MNKIIIKEDFEKTPKTSNNMPKVYGGENRKGSKSKLPIALLVAVMCLVAVAPAITSGSSFPAEVVSHSADLDGSGLYNDPQAVLGEPTTWNADCHAVSMVCPAWGTNESGDKVITTLNDGSYIIVKFDHHVEDNPLGIDFLVFGNAFYQGSGPVAPDTDMETHHITNAGGGVDPGDSVNVAVSQDGTNWYVYGSGPYGDTGYPTNAKKWDRINHQWGDLLDFTRPVDPSIDPAHFINKCVADVIDNYYCGSGGGTAQSHNIALQSPNPSLSLSSSIRCRST